MDEVVRVIAHTFAGPPTRRPLSIDETASGLTACYVNAVSLLDDVRCLVHADRYPRAAALVVLALEELAKIPDLHDTAVRASATGSTDGWTPFWRRFQSHESKQKRIAEYGKWLTASLGGATLWENPGPYSDFLPSDLGRTLDALKQRTFYVDFWNGAFVIPGSVPPELPEVVDALYALAVERADSFGAWHASTDRSRALLAEHISLPLAAGRPDETADPDAHSAEDLRIDLHTLLANRSSALIPDYASVYEYAQQRTAGLEQTVLSTAVNAEGALLADRIRETRFRTAGFRAWKMLKLLHGIAERLDVRLNLPDLGAEPPDWTGAQDRG